MIQILDSNSRFKIQIRILKQPDRTTGDERKKKKKKARLHNQEMSHAAILPKCHLNFIIFNFKTIQCHINFNSAAIKLLSIHFNSLKASTRNFKIVRVSLRQFNVISTSIQQRLSYFQFTSIKQRNRDNKESATDHITTTKT